MFMLMHRWLSCLHRAGPTVSRNELVDQFGQYVDMVRSQGNIPTLLSYH